MSMVSRSGHGGFGRFDDEQISPEALFSHVRDPHAMQAPKRSNTAVVAVFLRVAHLLVDDSPKVFFDGKVLPMLSSSARMLLRRPAMSSPSSQATGDSYF